MRGEDILRNRAKMTFFVLAIVLIAGLGGIWMSPNVMNPDLIFVSNSNVTEQNISIAGGFVSSGDQYRGYSVDYHDQALYVKIKGNIFGLPKSSGYFNINIENKYGDGDVNKIYIQGTEPIDHKLIWEKK